MVRALIALVLAMPATGCFLDESGSMMVKDSPFGTPLAVPPASTSGFAPAPTELAARVDGLGSDILTANPGIGIRPLFRTLGTAEVELFHRGTTEIDITEGMVRQCRSDAQLAALLCLELGRMVSEREALASPWNRKMEREPPLAVRIATDNGADRTQLAELGKIYEADRKRSVSTPPLPPDPRALARTFLTKAGFDPGELESVAPLLRMAESNGRLEKQLTAPGPVRPWTK
jgi:hypothetical protein